MFKSMKLKSMITVAVAVIAFAGMIFLYFTANRNMSNAMRQSALENMRVSLEGQGQVIEEYIVQNENLVQAYAHAPMLEKCVRYKKSAPYQQEAQEYTDAYFEFLDQWEGIYVADWDTVVMTHQNPDIIGVQLREGESLEQLRNNLLANEVYNAGIIVSPSSGKQVTSMYSVIYENGTTTPVGFAGGAVYADALYETLDELTENQTFDSFMINVATGLHIYDKDRSLAGQTIENPMLLNVISEIEKNPDMEFNSFNFVDEQNNKCIGMYNYLANRNWAIVTTAKESVVFSSVRQNGIVLGFICAIAYALIVILTWTIVGLGTKPLDNIEKSIQKLQGLDLNKSEEITPYIGQKNEMGVIASAVESLRHSFTQMVDVLKQSSDSLTGSSETMNAESSKLMNNVIENSATTQELAAGIISTNDSISVMENRMNQIVSMMNEVEKKLKEGYEKSEALKKSSQEMQEMVVVSLEASKENIERNRKNVNVAMTNLESLSQINQMATDILDITSQTNLLSLNATIEAARAGEAGKGFAVVASEIAKLADDSSETASKIQQICNETNSSIEAVQKCFDQIIGFLEKDVATRFKNISDSTQENNVSVEGIRNSMDEIQEVMNQFSMGIKEISEQVNSIKAASKDNEAAVEDIVEKNEETNTTVGVMTDVLKNNQENTAKLQNLVERFKL